MSNAGHKQSNCNGFCQVGLKSDRFSWDILSIDNKSIILSNFMTPWALELSQKKTNKKRDQRGSRSVKFNYIY